MSNVRRLYELQEVDIAIRDKKKAVADIESRLQDESTVVEAKLKLEEEEQHLSEMRKTEKQMEWDIEELSIKINKIDKQLYSGSVKNPKDLASLNVEFEHFKQRRGVIEESLLDLMADVEEQQRSFNDAKSEFVKVESAWRDNNGHLVEDKDWLNREIVELESKRDFLSSQMDKPSLDLYGRMRRSKGDEPIARVEQGMCKGCRINLPTHTLQKTRMGQELVYCTNCGRILYVS